MNNFQIRFYLLFILVLLASTMNGQVKLNMADTTVQANEIVCMDIILEDFTDILTLQFSLNWDPNVLAYERTENYGIPISAGDFNTDDVGNGRLSFIWIDPGLNPRTVPDGQVLFSICFRAVGPIGSISPVRFTDNPTMMDAVDGTDQSIGIMAQDASVQVIEPENNPDALEIYYDDVVFTKGESFCVPIRVRNFRDLTAVQFSLKFNNNRFRFDEVKNIENWGGAGFVAIATNNANTNGEIGYAYIDFSVAAEGNSSNDGDAIFEMCFTHLLEEDCVLDEIIISSTPTEILATKSPGDFEVPIIFTPGKLKLEGGVPIVIDDAIVEGVDCRDALKGFIDLSVSGGTATTPIFNWSTGETTPRIENLGEGTYDVSISDECLSVDTLFASFTINIIGQQPQANAGMDQELLCQPTSVTLDGSSSSTGSNFSYIWTGLDGQTIDSGASTNQATVSQPGRYELVVENSVNGCTDTDTVEVADLRTTTSIEISGDNELTCDTDAIILTGVGTNGAEIDYQWTSADGEFTIIDKESIEITSAGTYVLNIVNANNGCSDSDSFIVTGSNEHPSIAISGGGTLDCITTSITLNANDGADADPDAAYSWTTQDGNIVQGTDQVNAEVNEGGRYWIEVTSLISGCSVIDSIDITDTSTDLNISISGDSQLDCNVEAIVLTGIGSNSANISYTWTTADGSFNEIDKENIEVTVAGTYNLDILDSTNGCSASDSFIVTGSSEKPQASISGTNIIDCNNPSITLNANNGGGAAAGIEYLWTTVDGNIVMGENSVNVEIDQSGTYNVRVTSTSSGCFDDASLLITQNIDQPSISEPNDESIDCANEMSSLSVSSGDGNLTYMWNVVEGNGQIISSGTSNMIDVIGAGKFEVVATNPINGCMVRDTSTITLNGDILLAQVGDDYNECNRSTSLSGNIEAGISGQWTVVNGNATIENPNEANTTVNNLDAGANTFVWTLSSDACQDYSSDSITINLVPEPIAQDDRFEANQGFGSISMDLLANDLIDDRENAVVSILTDPSIGQLIETDIGVYLYEIDNDNAFGTFSFQYELCDGLCSMNCAVANVTIVVRQNGTPIDPETPSTEPQSLGITPNGDGLNEFLVFDELINNPELYQTKRLLVYNRWGDIVHESQPYQNDWSGTGKSGQPLPQGTYYFVMQLDIGRGWIIEGDVTILK